MMSNYIMETLMETLAERDALARLESHAADASATAMSCRGASSAAFERQMAYFDGLIKTADYFCEEEYKELFEEAKNNAVDFYING